MQTKLKHQLIKDSIHLNFKLSFSKLAYRQDKTSYEFDLLSKLSKFLVSCNSLIMYLKLNGGANEFKLMMRCKSTF